jgi:hypothetical protein
MIEFKLTLEEANLIIAGLQELPARASMQLILKLQAEGQKQFEEQNKPKLDAAEMNGEVTTAYVGSTVLKT